VKKRYVCGLREVARALKSNKARVLIIAHNIERIQAEVGAMARAGLRAACPCTR
jgi:ribosomal protein L30E